MSKLSLELTPYDKEFLNINYIDNINQDDLLKIATNSDIQNNLLKGLKIHIYNLCYDNISKYIDSIFINDNTNKINIHIIQLIYTLYGIYVNNDTPKNNINKFTTLSYLIHIFFLKTDSSQNDFKNVDDFIQKYNGNKDKFTKLEANDKDIDVLVDMFDNLIKILKYIKTLYEKINIDDNDKIKIKYYILKLIKELLELIFLSDYIIFPDHTIENSYYFIICINNFLLKYNQLSTKDKDNKYKYLLSLSLINQLITYSNVFYNFFRIHYDELCKKIESLEINNPDDATKVKELKKITDKKILEIFFHSLINDDISLYKSMYIINSIKENVTTQNHQLSGGHNIDYADNLDKNNSLFFLLGTKSAKQNDERLNSFHKILRNNIEIKYYVHKLSQFIGIDIGDYPITKGNLKEIIIVKPSNGNIIPIYSD